MIFISVNGHSGEMCKENLNVRKSAVESMISDGLKGSILAHTNKITTALMSAIELLQIKEFLNGPGLTE